MKIIQFLEEVNHDYFWKEQLQAFGLALNISTMHLLDYLGFIQGTV